MFDATIGKETFNFYSYYLGMAAPRSRKMKNLFQKKKLRPWVFHIRETCFLLLGTLILSWFLSDTLLTSVFDATIGKETFNFYSYYVGMSMPRSCLIQASPWNWKNNWKKNISINQMSSSHSLTPSISLPGSIRLGKVLNNYCIDLCIHESWIPYPHK